MAQANTLRGAFDETGNIGKHKAKFIAAARLSHSHNAEIR